MFGEVGVGVWKERRMMMKDNEFLRIRIIGDEVGLCLIRDPKFYEGGWWIGNDTVFAGYKIPIWKIHLVDANKRIFMLESVIRMLGHSLEKQG
jgi:hypothetical protein